MTSSWSKERFKSDKILKFLENVAFLKILQFWESFWQIFENLTNFSKTFENFGKIWKNFFFQNFAIFKMLGTPFFQRFFAFSSKF